ncbi:glucosyl transferase, partial [bacterium]
MATRPLKVCFVTGEYPPDEGGVADYTACLSAALAAQGAVVDVVTARGSGAARPANGAGD